MGWACAGLLTAGVASSFYHAQEEEAPVDWVNMRKMSTPEVIFQRFASTKDQNGEPMMTKADFLRVITPFVVPHDIDALTTDPDLNSLLSSIDLNSDGLISYGEFLFFTTLLSIPTRFSHVAFKMFDSDCSGSIDASEFKEMMQLIAHANPIAQGSEESKYAPLESLASLF